MKVLDLSLNVNNEEDAVKSFAWSIYDNNVENNELYKIISLYIGMYNNSFMTEGKLNEMNDSVKMRATTEWMAAKYAEMNDLLFGGELGECDFNIFTTGRGSQGGVLGWFKIKGSRIKANRYDRRLFQQDWYGDKTYVTRKNFYTLCRPMIELNGHYSATEDSLLATLVHEMCHYYTYMYGYCPKQGHGPEFRSIAATVSSRSNGVFTVQRVASAEEMKGYELDADMQAKKDARIANKKSKMIVVLVFKKDGKVELTITTSRMVVDEIVEYNTRPPRIGSTRNRDMVNKIITSNDARLVDLFYGMGFRKAMRTYRYWTIDPTILGGENFVEKNYDYKLEYSEDKQLKVADSVPTQKEPMPSIKPKKTIFSIKTNKGVVEIDFNGSYIVLKNKLKERFPNMGDEALEKIIQNKSNYRVMESKMNYSQIIESVINEYFANEFADEDSVEITPDMNLGKMSPLEY